MPIVGGMDIHRKQITFDYVDLATGEVVCGQIAPADRRHLRAWLERFEGIPDVAFAFEACTGWRYVAAELARAGVQAHLAEPADTAAARGRKKRAKTDLLTELPYVAAAQEAQPSPRPTAGVSERCRSPGRSGHAASLVATETGHTVLNHLSSFSSLPIFDVSRGGP